MAENSAIQWTDHTFNPWIGCTKISVGPQGACESCYAEVATPARAMQIQWGAGKPRHRTSASTWALPLRYERNASAFHAVHGRRQRVFCASLADVFDNEVDPRWRADLFRLIRETPSLDWLLLTKRIGNAAEMIDQALTDGHLLTSREPFWPWPNVWLGATLANQKELERDIIKLLRIPARVHFISHEPGLGPLDLEHISQGEIEWNDGRRGHLTINALKGAKSLDLPPVDLVITGGESGRDPRRYDIGWARDIIEQCRRNGRAAFVKQLGAVPTWDGCAGPNEHWPSGTQKDDGGMGYWELQLRDRKGGDVNEWPPDLRVQNFPRLTP